MNDTNNNDGAAEDRPTTAADDAELRALDERMGGLRAQGILGGGEEPRGSLRPIAHVPRATARFIERRGRR